MNTLQKLQNENLRKDLPVFKAGDTLKVHTRIKEGDKERIQIFEGVVLRRKGHACEASFTVRKVSYGVGVERVFPLYSPMIDKLEVVSSGKVRRARLYYLRKLSGKKARIEGVEGFHGKGNGEAETGSSQEPEAQGVSPDIQDIKDIQGAPASASQAQ